MESIKNFFKYWIHRYLLRTELYMVEVWERVAIHVFFILAFGLFSYFNTTILTGFTEKIVQFVKAKSDTNESFTDSAQNYLSCMYSCLSNWISTFS